MEMKNKMEKQIIFNGRIVLNAQSKSFDVFDIDSVTFEELKKLGKYGSKDNTQWVILGNVTYFPKDKLK